MRRPATMNIDAMARKVDVDNRIPLRNYYRIANNLLRQASIHRGEKNIIDLYIILLRYSSLVTETIPSHRDYQALHPKERALSKKMLLTVLDELEGLKPEFQRQFQAIGEVQVTAQPYQVNNLENHRYRPVGNSFGQPSTSNKASSYYDNQWAITNAPSSTWKQNNEYSHISSPSSFDKQFQKLSFNFSVPKQETLSRHSFFGPNGLRGQWPGPSSEIKVNYPVHDDLAPNEIWSLNPVEDRPLVSKDTSLIVDKSSMESVLSLDDGRWLHPTEDSNFQFLDDVRSDNIPLSNLRQPSPPPVLAQLQQEFRPISPSKVADPRPGPAKCIQDVPSSSNSFQHLHVPVRLMEDFLRLARENTKKNLETCGVLAGSLKNRVFHITTLIVPKQESTSDSCQTLNEEEIFDVQDKRSLFPLGWIHTHPSQTCFMSSVDLHTHYSYQIMLPEAIAIVMAPTDTASPHGIFHLSDPAGVSVIRKCQQRGFHPHEEPEDGSPIYEHCSHVYMNANMKFDIVDLR
ncbi:AMSH-like ubiquitin thioesterase 3 [Solanum lycopersicum]|uniref:MPN domain-containing protein n=1 Tax=Solanum lycopersicum TaxID=4081 RepID=A0A3Q7EYJ7_SOLLC|nr:AMSH-like ubiquitin thioesterase 3 [Solanum lycopersicum]